MEQLVSAQQMKDALAKEVGSKFPLKITLRDNTVLICYARGFADQQQNILLISETSYSLAMKIVEIKDIRILKYASENTSGRWKSLHARWLMKQSKL